MKYFIFSISVAILFIHCKNEPKQETQATQVTAPNVVSSDSMQMADLVHHFYQWYDSLASDRVRNINFIDDKAKHLKLDSVKLKTYLDYFKLSGFVSDAFLKGELHFYKECEKFWQHESKAEIPSCMDADKYFCAQDWEIKNWITGPIKINFNKNDSASITYLILDSLDNQERKIECQKLNGQWLISKIECDLGQNID